MEADNYLALILWHKGPRFVIARRPQADVAISGRQLRFRRWLSCDLVGYCEIATSACGLLAMTNLMALRQ